jgi:hypothetical protein
MILSLNVKLNSMLDSTEYDIEFKIELNYVQDAT